MGRPRGDLASVVAAEWARLRAAAEDGDFGPGRVADRSFEGPGAGGPGTGQPWAGELGAAPFAASAVVIGDAQPHLARELLDAGLTVTRWNRHFSPGQRCSPWPPSGPFDEAWVRMPRAATEAAMLLHAAAARVPDGGCIHLYGAGHEGIRSAAKHFPAGSGRVRTVLVKRRCRVLAATRGAPPPRADALDSWEIRAPIDWGTGPRDWTFYPGVFACGRLDPATKLLIEQLPGVVAGAWRAVARRAGGEAGRTNGDAGRADEKSVSGRDGARGGRRLRVLDFGAGAGAVGAAVLDLCGGVTTNDNTSQRQESGDPRPHVTLLERDAIALAAAARNVPAATLVLGSRVSHAHGPFDLVVSNPPIHAGGAQTFAVVEALIDGARRVLAPGGRIALVAQRRLPVAQLLARAFRRVRTVADRDSFRVWAAG